MSVTKKLLGKFLEKDVYSYRLDNQNGLCAEIMNYGGIVTNLVYKDVDVVLGKKDFNGYLKNPNYFGAIVGRNANRIENAEFTINRKKYFLEKNEGNNSLHSGKSGFNSKVWDAEAIVDAEPKLVLNLFSPDGEGGFPGNLTVSVTYTLTKNNSLKIEYVAKSDEDTVFNPTNHSYFNLNGHGNGNILNHRIWTDSCFFLPSNKENIPNGEILSNKNTPFSLNGETTIGDALKIEHKQTKLCSGFDHSLVLSGDLEKCSAKLVGDKTGIEMYMYTDRPCVQIYTSNSSAWDDDYKDNAQYQKHCAICLETQAFPNNLKYSHFPDSILRKNEKFHSTTVYRFV